MFPRIQIRNSRRTGIDGEFVHEEPKKGPPRHDLRKVRVLRDDPDLGEDARAENPGVKMPGSFGPSHSK
jgi:hypothetical protein